MKVIGAIAAVLVLGGAILAQAASDAVTDASQAPAASGGSSQRLPITGQK